MKKILAILFICLLQKFAVGQTTYYVAANGNDANNGTSTSTPWQTINKTNATTFSAGDHVLFRKGDTFVGGIHASNAGRSGSPVTYGAYGTGANPIITGFTTVTAWTNKGGNIWESTNAASTVPYLGMVLINGVSTPMGRYPNGDASYPYLPNYFTFQSSTGNGTGASSITSSSLSGGVDWTGAEIVLRINQWTLDKETVTSQSGNTLNYNGDLPSNTLVAGWGFFIQNDIRTLDQQGEWYYNPSTKKISIYSTTQPVNVQVSTVDTLFQSNENSATVNYTNVDNISFVGGNTFNLWIPGTTQWSITNCAINYAGQEGIVFYGGVVPGALIDKNTFYGNGSSAIYSTGDVSNLTITNNNINMSGIISAYKQNMWGFGAIFQYMPNSLIQYNTVDSSGYTGIDFKGANTQVRNNFVNHSALLRGDAGGIYSGFANEGGKVIDGNIVLNSEGNPRGTLGDDYFAFGIYSDDFGNHIQITNNTIANAHTAAIYMHNSNNEKVRNNTIYNCGSLIGETMWATGGISIDGNGSPWDSSIFSDTLTNNQIFSLTPSQNTLWYTSENGSNNDVTHFGLLDSNYYVSVNSGSKISTDQPQISLSGTLSLAQWQTATGKDLHTTEMNISDANNLRMEYNASKTSSVVSLGANYKDVKGNTYPGTVTIQPYSSVVLIYNFAAPTLSISGDQSITVDNTNISAVATWASGHGGSYHWTKTSGPGATTIGSPNNFSTSVSNLQNGTYVFRCTVTQDDGQTAYKEVTVVVNIPVAPPNAYIKLRIPTKFINL